METAKLGKQTYQYERETFDYSELPPITHDDAKQVLFETQDIFKSIGLDIYLSFGTLLGAVRDKDFIKGDLDVDVYVKDERFLFQHLKDIDAAGLKLVRARKHYMYSFRYKKNPNCYIDVYILKKTFSIWGIYCYSLLNFMTPKKLLRDGSIEFLGRTFACPKDPEAILEFWYTDTWRTPIGKFQKKYYYEVKSHYYYRKALKNTKLFTRRIISAIIGDDMTHKLKEKLLG